MSRVSKFAARDPGPSARIVGFAAHLRDNGLRLGVAEADQMMTALNAVNASNADDAALALKTICTGCKEDFDRFDALFDSYWRDAGRVKHKSIPKPQTKSNDESIHSSRDGQGEDMGSSGQASAPEGGDGECESDGEGRLMATQVKNLMQTDLRELVRPEDIAEAEKVARRMGAAMRNRRSRRRIAARRGQGLHFRKTIRRSLGTGGEPLALIRKKRPDRPQKIVSLCDVSGSMTLYAQVYLAFVAGLIRADDTSDAYLFHTRLVRITEALREKDALRAIGRLSLLADGFGGGSDIGPSLQKFADTYARRFVDGRTTVLILSDGYDTAPAEVLSNALAKLRKRGCKIIWLNPMKSWRDYAPIAAGMAAAMPHLDRFVAAATLQDIAALEQELKTL